MPESIIGLPADQPGGKKLHTRQRTVTVSGTATAVEEQYVIPLRSSRRVLNRCAGSTYRVVGAAALTQDICAIYNDSGASTNIWVTRIEVMMDPTAALTAVGPKVTLYRSSTQPTGGAVTVGQSIDSGDDVYGAGYNQAMISPSTTDGGTNTAISNVTIATQSQIKSKYVGRQQTAAGYLVPVAIDLCPASGLGITPGSGLVIRVEAAATTSNPATNHWLTSAEWERYDIP